MVARWWEEIGDLSEETLDAAIGSAWREFPTHFPALGELADYCARVAKRKQSADATRRLPEVSSAPGEMTPEVLAAIELVKGIR